MKRQLLYMLMLLCATVASAQPRKVQNRPFLDDRKLHYGFLLGVQMQDMEFRNNGYVDPNTGEQWYAEVDQMGPGFNVGVLGELKINRYLAARLVPTLYFGERHVNFREQVSGRDSAQTLRSTIITVPIDMKFAAPRYNNFRPYMMGGFAPSVDLTTRKHQALLTKPFDCYIEFGFGCDIYMRYFKLCPELKFCFGMLDVLQKKRNDLINGDLRKFTSSIDKAHSKFLVLSFYFE